MEPGDIELPVGCVVRALPGSLPGRDVLDVEPLNQLHNVLTLGDNEELVSQIIRISTTGTDMEDIQVTIESISDVAHNYGGRVLEYCWTVKDLVTLGGRDCD